MPPTPCLSVADVAGLLLCSENHVTDLLRTGQLEGVKVGVRRWAITEPACEAFLDRTGDQRRGLSEVSALLKRS